MNNFVLYQIASDQQREWIRNAEKKRMREEAGVQYVSQRSFRNSVGNAIVAVGLRISGECNRRASAAEDAQAAFRMAR